MGTPLLIEFGMGTSLRRGDYTEAAQRFEDPLWKGTAFYYNQDFTSALAEFAKVDTARGWFNRGNALAHLERYEEATEAYRHALELKPDYPEAQANLEYLERREAVLALRCRLRRRSLGLRWLGLGRRALLRQAASASASARRPRPRPKPKPSPSPSASGVCPRPSASA